MKRIVAAAAAIAVLSAGCAQIDELVGSGPAETGSASAPPPSPSPTPTPAISTADAKRVVSRWVRAYNKAAKRYDIKAAARLETGSILQAHRAEYAICRRNGVRLPTLRATADLTIPRFTGWPKWFTVSMPSKSNTLDLDEFVFVQSRAGEPWRAAYDTMYLPRVRKDIGKGVTVPEDARVVPPDDTSLAVTPARLPAVHAHAARYGSKSPYWRLFSTGGLLTGTHKGLIWTHRLLRRKGWRGRTSVAAAPHPTYAVRTASGGALVFYALDRTATYERVTGHAALDWKEETYYGTLYPALIGRERVKNSFSRVERIEFATYIPPKDEDKIHLVASRWMPVSAEGA